MNIKIDTLVYELLGIFRHKKGTVPDKYVEESVRETMSQYKITLKYLELYDKGKVSSPKNLARYSNLRDYLQSI